MESGNTVTKTVAAYVHPSPYPDLKVYGKNRNYAELLMDDYCGAAGEFTAANQYKYHAFMLKRTNAELAEMLSGIADVEAHHLELLAGAIRSLGGNPVFRGSGSAANYWSGDKLEYGKDVAGRLKSDLASETNAIDTYREHIQKIQDPGIQALLRRIVLDEEIHAQLFREAIEKYGVVQETEKKEEVKAVRAPGRYVRRAIYSSRR